MISTVGPVENLGHFYIPLKFWQHCYKTHDFYQGKLNILLGKDLYLCLRRFKYFSVLINNLDFYGSNGSPSLPILCKPCFYLFFYLKFFYSKFFYSKFFYSKFFYSKFFYSKFFYSKFFYSKFFYSKFFYLKFFYSKLFRRHLILCRSEVLFH
jgi:hypothetical protein